MKKLLIIINNFFIIPILIIFFIQILYDYTNGIINIFYTPSIIFAWLLFTTLFIFFIGITGKSTKSHIIVLSLAIIIYIINQIKLIYTGEPLFLSDFSFVSNTTAITGFVKNSFIKTCLPYLKYLIFIFIGAIILIIYLKKFKLDIKTYKKRLILVLSSIIIMLTIFLIPKINNKLLLNLFFQGENKLDYISYTNYKDVYSIYGIFGGMYNQYLDTQFVEPENYNEKELNNLLENTQKTNEKQLGTPNIIVILSESFFDVELLNENIKFNKKITSNFNKLKKEGELVNIISPTYGGMTANVAFELLTGVNTSYFHSGYIPFMQLYKDKKIKPSITKELKKNGYYNEVIMGQDSYNSSEVFYELGFSKYTKLEKNQKNQKGYYISDKYLTNLLIDKLNKQTKEKNFYLIETMQSHMDYSIKKYHKYDIEIEESNLNNKDQETLLSYAQGIYDADIMLKEIYEHINKLEQETIIIFFGDHIPYLQNEDGKDIKNNLAYFNTNDEKINLYRKYNTQALILSNYDTKLEIPDNLGFDMLLTYIVNNMDINLSNYYYWLYSESTKLSTYNRYVYLDMNNDLNYIKNIKNEELNSLKLRNKMTYKLFIK